LDFQHESVAACWGELFPLAQAHAASTQSYRRHEPFNPLLSRYEAVEHIGMYRLLTARDAGKLVGYFGLYLTESMHSQLPLIVEDTFFLHPDYRKGRNAIRFIRYCEERAREWGAQEILFSCEADNRTANSLLQYLDYQPVIMQYSKRLCPLPPDPTGPQPPTEDLSHVCTKPAACS
jgi:GNAT superfamily N-acetyltransferase